MGDVRKLSHVRYVRKVRDVREVGDVLHFHKGYLLTYLLTEQIIEMLSHLKTR